RTMKRLWIVIVCGMAIGGEAGAQPPKEFTPQAKKAVGSLLLSVQGGLLIGLEDDVKAVKKHKGEALAVPEVIKLLRDSSALSRASAAQTLGLLGAPARPAIAALAECLKDKNALVQENAQRALGRLGPLPAELAAVVVEGWLNQKFPPFDPADGEAVAGFGPGAIPGLVRAFADPKGKLRRRATFGLKALGPEALEAVPALVKALHDKDREVRKDAIQALGKIGDEAVPQLIAALKHDDPGVRADACR